MDNYATHKTPLIRKWLAKRPRWHVHLTPTSSSWLNQVERFFGLITERKIRRGIYRSVAALRADITSFIEHHNADPRPFRWTKSADDILQLNRTLLRLQFASQRLNATNFWFRTLADHFYTYSFYRRLDSNAALAITRPHRRAAFGTGRMGRVGLAGTDELANLIETVRRPTILRAARAAPKNNPPWSHP